MTADLLARNLAAHWIQSGLLAAAAIAAIWLLTLKEPRFRLVSFQFVLLAIVLLPLIQPWRPDPLTLQTTPGATAISRAAPASVGEIVEQSPARSFDPARGIVLMILAGIAIRLSWLGYGIFGLMRFSREAPELPAPTVAGELEAALQVSPRYIQQTVSRGPWTFGFLRPTVALPAGFDARAAAFQRAVICHELLHVKRCDMAVAFGEELAVAALWFHPWIWLLRARIRVAREQVVDGHVVTLLANRDEYVRCLVEISGHDLAPHFSQAGAGMLRPRELRARVDAIFQEGQMSRMRFAIAAFVFVAITAATGLLAAGAMPLRANVAAPDGQATSNDAPRRQINTTYAEYPQDALQRGIRGTVLIDITVNAAGDVSTGAVVSGPQELRASAFKAALALKFAPGPSTTAMRIPIEYVLSTNFWGVRVGDASANSGTGGLMIQTGSPAPDDSGAIRVGGSIRPPRKLRDVQPVYPDAAREAGVQGVVILEATVDERGNISNTRVLRSIPLLDQAAIDAVKQWQYTPTMLNGVAVPVVMTMTVNFTLRVQVRLRINMPDGTLVVLRINPDGGIGRIEHPGMSRFGFAPFLSQDLSADTVRVTIYEVNEPGNAPRTLGNVELKVGGGVVQSTTTPSFGIELVSIERP